MSDVTHIDQDRAPPAPGEVLKEKLLGAGQFTQRQVADALGISPPRLAMVFNGRCTVSEEIALRVERAFGISPNYWMRVRDEYELHHARQRLRAVLAELPPAPNRDVHASSTWFRGKWVAA